MIEVRPFTMLIDRYPSGLEHSWFKGCQAFTDSMFSKFGYAVDVQFFRKLAGGSTQWLWGLCAAVLVEKK